jgi:hypothetical protein
MTQTATQITIAEFRQTVEAVAHDLRAEREHYGKTWEEVDDLLPEMCETEWCIYSARAEELVDALMSEDREAFREALAMYEEFWDDNWSTATNAEYRLAYCATEIAVRQAVEAMKEQDIPHQVSEALDWIVSKARRDLFDLRDEFEFKFGRVGEAVIPALTTADTERVYFNW